MVMFKTNGGQIEMRISGLSAGPHTIATYHNSWADPGTHTFSPINISINGVLGYWGISLTTATDAVLMIVGEVLFTTVLAAVVASERLGQLRFVGLGLGVVGVVVLFLLHAAANTSRPNIARRTDVICVIVASVPSGRSIDP